MNFTCISCDAQIIGGLIGVVRTEALIQRVVISTYIDSTRNGKQFAGMIGLANTKIVTEFIEI